LNIIDCDIRSNLPDEVTSFNEYGNGDLTRDFPPEVASLDNVVDDD